MSLPAIPPRPVESGLRRSALLMRALGARAANVWSQLSPEEAQQLSAAMQALPEDAAAEQNAVNHYVRTMSDAPQSAPGRAASAWDRLASAGGNTIARLVREESPQVIALILSRLPPEAAAQTVQVLPRALATEALKRMLSLGDVHPAAITALERYLDMALQQAETATQAGGHEHVARIFDSLDSRSEQSLLAALNTVEPGAGEKIRALMFTFEDLAGLDPASLQTLLGNVDRAVLILALKGASEAITEAFFKNITQRAGDLLREEIDSTGPIRRREVEAARAEIIALARTLVKRGDILDQSPDDELVE